MKRHCRCIHCGSLRTTRVGKLLRKSQGPLQRFRCWSCRKSFTLGTVHGAKISLTQKVKLAKTHLEGRTSIRQLVRDTSHGKQTIQNAIHEVVANCVDSHWVASNLRPNWSGYLAVDGTTVRVWDWAAHKIHYTKRERRYLHKLVWLVALDLGTLDIVHHHLGQEETMIDLVLFYRQLKTNGYQLKGLVSDGNPDIRRAALMVYQSPFAYQHCQRHFLEGLKVKVRQGELKDSTYLSYYHAIKQGTPLPGLPKALFTYQLVPQLPTTNQQIENLFRQLKLRTRSIGQFRSWQTASNYLNAWSLCRRFTPFTDCRDKNKNKRAPLTLAGCDISKLNYLQLKSKIHSERGR